MPETLVHPLIAIVAGAGVGIAGVDVIRLVQRLLGRKPS